MIDILSSTTPIFLLIGLGFIAVRAGGFEQAGLRFLGAYVVRVSLPVMMFKSVAQRSLGEVLELPYLAAYALGSLAALGVGVAVARGLRRHPLDFAAVQGLGMAMPNSMFVGYPVAHQLLGDAAALGVAMSVLVENLMTLPIGLALADSGSARHAHFGAALWHAVSGLRRNPLIVALFAGLLFAALRLPLPAPLWKGIDMLAASAPATALFYIGGSLVGQPLRAMAGEMATVNLGKLVLHPLLVGVCMLVLWPGGGAVAMTGVVLASSPMMSIYPIIGQKYDRQGFCAATLVVATASAFVTMSVLIWLLKASGLFAAG